VNLSGIPPCQAWRYRSGPAFALRRTSPGGGAARESFPRLGPTTSSSAAPRVGSAVGRPRVGVAPRGRCRKTFGGGCRICAGGKPDPAEQADGPPRGCAPPQQQPTFLALRHGPPRGGSWCGRDSRRNSPALFAFSPRRRQSRVDNKKTTRTRPFRHGLVAEIVDGAVGDAVGRARLPPESSTLARTDEDEIGELSYCAAGRFRRSAPIWLADGSGAREKLWLNARVLLREQLRWRGPRGRITL